MLPQSFPGTLVRRQRHSLIVGHAPWWISQELLSANNKKFQKQSFAEALKDFLQNVSFHCYGKLVEPGRRFHERFFWLIFHAVALAILIIFLWNRYDNRSRLLQTTIYDPLYPIAKVAFPAISICSISRISNASAMRYAAELNSKDPLNRSASYFYEQIHMFSYYYSGRENLNYERARDFQRILDLYDTEESELFYNTRRHMNYLTPRCSDILLECRLGGLDVNCSAHFVESLTSRGICCTFNHDGRYASERSYKMRLFGIEQGLVLLLNSSVKDSYFDSPYFQDFVAMVYSYNDFPDVVSGSVTEQMIIAGYDNHVYLDSIILQTVSEARVLSPRVRNCYFAKDLPRAFGKQYSFNKCITRCRTRVILVLCGCLPFQMPIELLDAAAMNAVFCTLQHLECLNRYHFKWFNVITRRASVVGLEHEMEDALYCPYCLPSCTQTKYFLRATIDQLNAYNMRTYSEYFNTLNGSRTDLAILQIGFSKTHVHYYQQILTNSWYEVFSNIGNICGIITGFSLIAFFEVLYFLIHQFWKACNDESSERKLNRKKRNIKENANEMKADELLILP